ncbi:MAG: hypothetical protein JXR69_05855 [Candidatus Delongbacteria bacterium]|nr:hypothetical protein [Candidatus Delongbacteria bacterium]
MRKFTLLLIVVLSLSFLGCGGKTAEKEAIKTNDTPDPATETVEKKLPEGYPEELVIPFDLGKRMTTGDGTGKQTITKDGEMSFGKERNFKSFNVWQSMPKQVPEIISHFKKLFTDLQYEGVWKGEENNAYGVFKKDDNEIEIHISEDQFKFGLKIWDVQVLK